MNNIEHLLAPSQQLSDLSDLIDHCFQVPPGHHFFDDFPVWDPRLRVRDVKQFRVVDPGTQKLVASASVRLAQLKVETQSAIESETVKIAIIGAVCCDSSRRKRGLATQLVTEATQWAERSGAAAVYLWSSEQTLYRRLGYEPCGEQIRVALKNIVLNNNILNNIELTGIKSGWAPAIFTALMQRKDGLALAVEDLSWYAKHKNVQWYSVDQSYVAIGRGIDMQNHIHEWGGDRNRLIQIFNYILNINPDVIVLGSRKHFEFYGFKFKDSSQILREYLCLSKALRPTSESTRLSSSVWFWGLDSA